MREKNVSFNTGDNIIHICRNQIENARIDRDLYGSSPDSGSFYMITDDAHVPTPGQAV